VISYSFETNELIKEGKQEKRRSRTCGRGLEPSSYLEQGKQRSEKKAEEQ
jgi:hypothetical protein